MANGEGHRILTRAALESLPEWERELLAPVKEDLEREYCMYGDDYFGHKAELGPYVELPDGRLPMDPWEIRHFRKDGPGDDYFICGYYDLMRSTFTHFAAKCVECIRKGDITGFAKFAGTVAHVIEDCGCPPHAVGTTMGTDMKMLKLLSPAPDAKMMARQYHAVFEGQYEPFSIDRTPRLMGLSPEEISFNLFERFTDMIENSITKILPMLDAFHKDDARTMKARLTESGEFSSGVLADFIHSTLCVGRDRVDCGQKGKLASVNLGDYTPETRMGWMPFPYFYPEIRKAPWCLDKDFNPIPLSLVVNGEETLFESGFGVGVPFKTTYTLPLGVYKKFSVQVGIHSKLGAKAGIVFTIMGDGAALATAGCPDASSSPCVSADISKVRKLTLTTSVLDGDKAWPDNTHSVWGAPVLIRR